MISVVIEELKKDLQAEGFRIQDFHATEGAFPRDCFTYNLLSLYQHADAPESRKAGFKPPATLRAAVFIGGASRLLGDAAIADDEHAVAGLGEILIVSDDDQGDAVLGGEIHEDGHDFRAVS